MAEGSLKLNRKQRIFIVEDHPIFRDGISQLINKEDDLIVIGGCENSAECFKYIKDNQPDLIIVDITLKDSCGIELTKELKKTYPAIPVLILSMHEELIFADRVLKAGARGYITKREATSKVIEAIRRVLQGKIYICDTMIDHFLERSIKEKLNLQNNAELNRYAMQWIQK